MFCGKCVNQIPTGNNFCGRCGTPCSSTPTQTDYLPAYARFSQQPTVAPNNTYQNYSQPVQNVVPQKSQIQQSIENDVRNGVPLVSSGGNPSRTLR